MKVINICQRLERKRASRDTSLKEVGVNGTT